MNRTALLLVGLVTVGCAPKGDQRTRYASDIILDKYGAPNFKGPNKCPSGANADGQIQLTHKSTGKKRVKGKCVGGVMDGAWTAYYENGATYWKATLKSGQIVGTFTSYWANHKKKTAIAYKDGAADGKFKAWHFNGKVRAKGKFINGQKNGCWETWHDNGQKASKGTYSEDKKVLTWLSWTPAGDKSKEKLGGEALNGKCLITF